MVHPYHEIILINKKTWIIDICNNLDEFLGNYAEQKKLVPKGCVIAIQSIPQHSWNQKMIKVEDALVVVGGWPGVGKKAVKGETGEGSWL